MGAPPMDGDRLWAMSDGTVCLLIVRTDAPCFEVCLLRGENVLRQSRLYARGSAQMLSETWRCTLGAIQAEQQLLASQHSAVA